MKSYFVPFQAGKPATITVNGHRLLVLSRSSRVIAGSLPQLGGDAMERVRCGESTASEDKILRNLAKSVNAGVVIAPRGSELNSVIESLEAQLPWVQ